MHRKKSSVESLAEAFEFDNESSSNNSGLDQQIHWNNMLNRIEPVNLPNYLVPPIETNMSYMNMATQDGNSPCIWNSGGTSSRGQIENQGQHDETKIEPEWTSLRINAGGSTSEERSLDVANILSLENVNINLNSNQVDDDQSCIQNSNVLQDDSGIGGIRSEVINSGLPRHPASGILTLEHGPSTSWASNSCASSSIGVRFMAGDGDGQLGLDSRRSACKRKTIEGFLGQSSASGTNFLQLNENRLLHVVPAIHNPVQSIHLSSSADFISGASSSQEQLNARFSTIVRGMASECYPSSSVTANAESSQRNFRMRVNPVHQHDIYTTNSYGQESTSRHCGPCLSRQPSLFIPLNQSLESRTVIGNLAPQAQSHVPIIPTIPRNLNSFPWNGVPNSRIGNSSSSITSEQRFIAPRDEINSGIIPRSNLREQSAFVPSTDIRHLIQDPQIWSLENGTMSTVGNAAPPRTGTSPMIYPSLGLTCTPHQNSPTHHTRSLSEVVHHSLFPSEGSDSLGHSHNSPVRCSGQSSSSQEVGGHQSGPHYRNHHQPYMRSSFLLERQNAGLLGVPLSMRNLAAAREGRSRMLSEIRNTLDLMRGGENLRFEDVFIFDQAVLFGGVNLHDRHRGMRLDVDNMSYEELLALEERIGNVGTGLSEETILKSLRQQKYFLMQVEASMEEEPCCICQEEYVEGEYLGTLDCGHDFHTSCIKQWLMQKNSCPVCKTTALVT